MNGGRIGPSKGLKIKRFYLKKVVAFFALSATVPHPADRRGGPFEENGADRNL